MGCSLSDYQIFVSDELQYVPRRKKDPKQVLQMMNKSSEELELEEMEFRDSAKDGRAPKLGGSQ